MKQEFAKFRKTVYYKKTKAYTGEDEIVMCDGDGVPFQYQIFGATIEDVEGHDTLTVQFGKVLPYLGQNKEI